MGVDSAGAERIAVMGEAKDCFARRVVEDVQPDHSRREVSMAQSRALNIDCR